MKIKVAELFKAYAKAESQLDHGNRDSIRPFSALYFVLATCDNVVEVPDHTQFFLDMVKK